MNAAANRSLALEKWRYSVARATLALRVTASMVTALGPPERRSAVAASSNRARDRAGRGSRRPARRDGHRLRHLLTREQDYWSRYETVSLKSILRKGATTDGRHPRPVRPGYRRQPGHPVQARPLWLLTVAALDVLLVISSMVALNAALPDIAVETSATQTQLTWIVDGYTLVLACLLLPAGAIGDRYGRRGALLVGLAIFGLASIAPVFLDSPVADHHRARGRGRRRRVHHARDAVAVDRRVPEERSATRPSGSGRASRVPARSSASWAPGCCCNSSPGSPSSARSRRRRVGLFICTCTIRSSRDETATPLDWVGAVLIGAAVAVFVFGVVEAPERGWTQPAGLGLHGGGRRAGGRVRGGGAAAHASAARRPAVRQARLRHRVRRHHVPVLRQLRILLRRDAVHATGPRLQPAEDRVRARRRWPCRS